MSVAIGSREGRVLGGTDGRRLVHLPPVVRFAVLALFTLLCGATLYALTVHPAHLGLHDGPGGAQNWVLAVAALAQLAITGFLLFVVAFWSEREPSINSLKIQAHRFLAETVLEALRDIRLPVAGETRGAAGRVRVRRLEAAHNFATFRLSADLLGVDCLLHIFFNLNCAAIYFYAPLPDNDPAAAEAETTRLKQLFHDEIEASERIGMSVRLKTGYEEAADAECLVFCFARRFDEDFIGRPARKLALAQDIAQIARSILRTAARSGARLA